MLLQQVVIHPDIEGLWSLSEMDAYRTRIEQFAEEEKVPLADPLQFCTNLEACFERKEWYSATGHRQHFSRWNSIIDFYSINELHSLEKNHIQWMWF